MLKQFKFSLVVLMSISAVLTQAQTRACNASTLADVLGTSCSVGPLTLNFQNNFSGLHNIFSEARDKCSNQPRRNWIYTNQSR